MVNGEASTSGHMTFEIEVFQGDDPEVLEALRTGIFRENPLSKSKREGFQRSKNWYLARNIGAHVLNSVIANVAGRSFAGIETPAEGLDADPDFQAAFFSVLSTVKRAILEGRMTVVQVASGITLNDSPEIQAWCRAENSVEDLESGPSISLGIWKADLPAFYSTLGLPCPAPSEQVQQPENQTRRQRQLEVVLELIREKGWNPMEIPTGGKAELEDICLGRYKKLFTKAGFGHFWNWPDRKKNILVKDHEKFGGK